VDASAVVVVDVVEVGGEVGGDGEACGVSEPDVRERDLGLVRDPLVRVSAIWSGGLAQYGARHVRPVVRLAGRATVGVGAVGNDLARVGAVGLIVGGLPRRLLEEAVASVESAVADADDLALAVDAHVPDGRLAKRLAANPASEGVGS